MSTDGLASGSLASPVLNTANFPSFSQLGLFVLPEADEIKALVFGVVE